MSGNYERRALREAVRAVLLLLPEFQGWTQLRSWGQPIDPATLPAIGVMTPRETVDGLTGTDLRRSTEVHVHFVIAGGDDLEDTLDDQVEAAETAVYAVLQDRSAPLFGLEAVNFDIRAAGDQRIGSATLIFRETRYTQEPNS